eukprot:1720482-Amphidinium_carterae.1
MKLLYRPVELSQQNGSVAISPSNTRCASLSLPCLSPVVVRRVLKMPNQLDASQRLPAATRIPSSHVAGNRNET